MQCDDSNLGPRRSMMNNKIQKCHLRKPAYIYLRQSSMNQVRHNQESTERQYALRDKAIAFGWPANMIHILDGDLGLSGSQSALRKDFQSLVALVSMRKAGAVFALEASRLSRSCTDCGTLRFHGHIDHRRGWMLQSVGLQRSVIIGHQRNYVPSRVTFSSRAPPRRKAEQS